MNSYFFKMTNEEKNSILDQHKSLYDGYVTQNNNSKEQPLYVQDFANDKAGITVNNKGEVGEYRNMRINEMRHDGKSTGLFDEDAQSGTESIPSNTFEDDSYMVSVGEQLDMVGDGKDDLTHGTFGDNKDDDFMEDCEHCGGSGFNDENDEDCEWCNGSGFNDPLFIHKDDVYPKTKWSYSDDINLDIDDELQEPLMEQLNKTLDMFKRFNTY